MIPRRHHKALWPRRGQPETKTGPTGGKRRRVRAPSELLHHGTEVRSVRVEQRGGGPSRGSRSLSGGFRNPTLIRAQTVGAGARIGGANGTGCGGSGWSCGDHSGFRDLVMTKKS